MGVSHALMIRHSRRLPNEIIMLELFCGNNSRETNGIIIAFPSPGRLFTKIELVRWYETGCQVHTPLVERRTHQDSVTVICISCVLWGHQSNFASESLGGHSGEG